MASVNKVILVGNLGRDPEMRYSPDGIAVCNISIATTSKWKSKATGEQREETEWHRVVFYNKLAEIVGEYMRKGRSIYVEGRLKTRKWQDKNTGQDRYSTEVIADQMQMLGGPQNTTADAQSVNGSNSYAAAKSGSNLPPPPATDDMDDDIPF